jgi:DNA-binding HxlR family transcriptional regulator
MSIGDLIAIFHHRWSAPVLAQMYRQKGSRFAALAGTLGVGRESLRRTLDSLLELGLVARNPGYGHPLRPEYVLTTRGRAAADRCARLLDAADDEVVLRKWTLPVLAALAEAERFSDLRAALPGVTPRALALALKDLQAAGLVERRVEETYPPTTLYVATTGGRRLQRIVAP